MTTFLHIWAFYNSCVVLVIYQHVYQNWKPNRYGCVILHAKNQWCSDPFNHKKVFSSCKHFQVPLHLIQITLSISIIVFQKLVLQPFSCICENFSSWCVNFKLRLDQKLPTFWSRMQENDSKTRCNICSKQTKFDLLNKIQAHFGGVPSVHLPDTLIKYLFLKHNVLRINYCILHCMKK